MGSPTPQEVSDELRRVAERWQQLPLDHALSRSGAVRDLAQDLADRVGAIRGRGPLPLPDLGPAVLLDQLRVTVFDACAAGVGRGLADRLVALRRAL